MRWRQQLWLLQRDRRHGSLELLARFVELCHQMEEAEATAQDFRESIRCLIDAHPAMALFRRLAERFEPLFDEQAPASAFTAEAEQFLQEVQQHVEQSAEIAAQQLPTGATVLTHSASSHVRRVLEKALQRGKTVRLFCTVSEPGREGIRFAQWAHSAGIPVLLLAESQVGALLGDITLFLIGSDAVCQDGVVHKVGTALLAYRLWLEHRPVWVMSCAEKFVPQPWDESFAGTAPRISRVAVPQARPLYDCTPWEHLSVFVSESGFEDAQDVRTRLLASVE